MPPDTPLNKAHQHASNAEDYVTQGFLIPAAEEHYKSAEAFLQCVDQASDEGTKRTLRMLYNEHNKAGRELQRRVAKLKEEGKDPNLPQRSPTPPRSHTSPSPGRPSTPSHVIPRGRMGDSNHTIDDSYMVLGQQSDSMDTFNQFWKDLEGMLDNLSQPVAFATAPLARIGGSESVQGTDTKSFYRKRGAGSDQISPKAPPEHLRRPSKHDPIIPGQTLPGSPSRLYAEPNSILKGKTRPEASDPEEVMADEDSPSGESFFMIPSVNEPSLATNLQTENESLKLELASLRQRLDIAERMRVEQEEQLRERIVHARREAQRVKNSGLLPPRPGLPTVDLGSLNITIPSLTPISQPASKQDHHLMRRVKELEEEVKTVRVENEKQKAMIAKFRERWERLKESAKRKRDAKAKAISDTSMKQQRIDEEPEAEVAAEEGDTLDSI